MRNAFNMFFMSLTTIFTTLNRGATIVDNYAQWAEAESSFFRDEGMLTNQAKRAELEAKLKTTLKAVNKAA